MTLPTDSGRDAAPLIPGDEGLVPEPLPTWWITMRDLRLRVRAASYEHAVVWLESWCHEQGIERSGAEFVHEKAAQ